MMMDASLKKMKYRLGSRVAAIDVPVRFAMTGALQAAVQRSADLPRLSITYAKAPPPPLPAQNATYLSTKSHTT
jgi:hypothetical protein